MKRPVKTDMVNHPPHYTQGKIDVIDFIVDQKMDYCLGNAVKYLARYRHKRSPVEDLKKARFYVDRLIAQEEK